MSSIATYILSFCLMFAKYSDLNPSLANGFLVVSSTYFVRGLPTLLLSGAKWMISLLFS